MISLLSILVIVLLVFLWAYILLPIRMAKSRGRDVVVCLLLFWLLSPIVGVIVLTILGDSRTNDD